MPRIAGVSTPKYRKHKPTGQAVVTINGKDRYLGPHGTVASRREYDRLIREWEASGGALVQDKRDEITIVEMLDAFWRHCKEYYGPDSNEPQNYKTLIKRLRKLYGQTKVKQFGPLALKAFRDSLIVEKLSRTTINHSVNRVRRIVKWAVENELAHPETLAALQCVSGLRYGRSKAKETEPVKPVADWAVDATLPYCSPQIAAMIALQRTTGMRSGEICRMTTGTINTSGSVWTYRVPKHKTTYRGHERIVYLGPKAIAIVREWLRSDLQDPLFQPVEAEAWRQEQRRKARRTPLSCGNRPGSNVKTKPKKKPRTSYDTQSYKRALEYAIAKANKERGKQGLPPIPHWHLHQLRHAHATHVRRECGIETARILLGHKSLVVTQVYAEADRQRAVEAAAKIG